MPTLQEISALAQDRITAEQNAAKKRWTDERNAKAAEMFEIFKGKVRSRCEACAQGGSRSWFVTDRGSPELLRLIEQWIADPENKWAVENRITVCPRFEQDFFLIEIKW